MSAAQAAGRSALALHPNANQAAEVTSHPRGNPRHRPYIQTLLSSAGWPPHNSDPQELGLQASGRPLSKPFPAIRKGLETSLSGLGHLCTHIDNHHKTIGMDKQTQSSANTICHNTDRDRDNKHLSPFLANNAIIKATKRPVFVAADITVGREPFEEISTGTSPHLNDSTSTLQRDAFGMTGPVITPLFQMAVS